jgi:hypothetical protein
MEGSHNKKEHCGSRKAEDGVNKIRSHTAEATRLAMKIWSTQRERIV